MQSPRAYANPRQIQNASCFVYVKQGFNCPLMVRLLQAEARNKKPARYADA